MQMTRADKEHFLKMLQADLAGEVIERKGSDGEWRPFRWIAEQGTNVTAAELLRIRPKPRELFVQYSGPIFMGASQDLSEARKWAIGVINPVTVVRFVEDLTWKEPL